MLTHSRKLATNHYIHERGKGRKVIGFFNTPTNLRNTLKSAATNLRNTLKSAQGETKTLTEKHL